MRGITLLTILLWGAVARAAVLPPLDAERRAAMKVAAVESPQTLVTPRAAAAVVTARPYVPTLDLVQILLPLWETGMHPLQSLSALWEAQVRAAVVEHARWLANAQGIAADSTRWLASAQTIAMDNSAWEVRVQALMVSAEIWLASGGSLLLRNLVFEVRSSELESALSGWIPTLDTRTWEGGQMAKLTLRIDGPTFSPSPVGIAIKNAGSDPAAAAQAGALIERANARKQNSSKAGNETCGKFQRLSRFHFTKGNPVDSNNPINDLAERCDLCRESVRDRLAAFDRRLLALEIVVRGEDGHNGMKAQLTALCFRFDAFEKKAIRWIAIGTSLPGVVVAVVAVLRFFGRV